MDINTAPRFVAALEDFPAEAEREIHVDLSGLTFMDSSGIHALLRGREIAHKRDQRYRLRPTIPKNILDLIDITGARSDLEIGPS